MKPEYIYELLREHSRVIIPNFGAFMLKEKYKATEDGRALMQISFNDFLKFNDGLLIDHVAIRDGIDKSAAESRIKEFISKVQYQLINQGSYKLESIGELYKDEKGLLKFRQESGDEPAAKEEPIKQETPPQITEAPKRSKTGLSPLSSNEEKAFSRPITSPEPANKQAPIGKIERPVTESTPTAGKTVPKPKPAPQVKLAPKKPQKQLLPIWKYFLTLILALVIILILLYFLGIFDKPNNGQQDPVNINIENTNDNKQDPANSENTKNDDKNASEQNTDAVELDEGAQSNNTTPQENSSVEEQETQVSEQRPAVINETVNKPVSADPVDANKNKNYHIIAASFQDKSEAHEFALKLRERGFNNARIVSFRNGYYRVCYNSYPTKQQALYNLTEVSEKVNPNAWYLYAKD